MFVDDVPLEGVRGREKSMIGSFIARGRTWSVPMKRLIPPRISLRPAFQRFGCILVATSADGGNSAGCAGS
jgi:hypothetical protein